MHRADPARSDTEHPERSVHAEWRAQRTPQHAPRLHPCRPAIPAARTSRSGLVMSAAAADLLSKADDLARARAAVEQVCDPEIPVLTIADLGVLRSVESAADGGIEVTIT